MYVIGLGDISNNARDKGSIKSSMIGELDCIMAELASLAHKRHQKLVNTFVTVLSVWILLVMYIAIGYLHSPEMFTTALIISTIVFCIGFIYLEKTRQTTRQSQKHLYFYFYVIYRISGSLYISRPDSLMTNDMHDLLNFAKKDMEMRINGLSNAPPYFIVPTVSAATNRVRAHVRNAELMFINCLKSKTWNEDFHIVQEFLNRLSTFLFNEMLQEDKNISIKSLVK